MAKSKNWLKPKTVGIPKAGNNAKNWITHTLLAGM